MTMFVIQTFLLIAIAMVLGVIAGALLRQLLSGTAASQPEKTDQQARVSEKPASPDPATPKTPPKPKPTKVAEKKPASVVQKAKPAPSPGPKDNLKRIDGIGPKNEKALNTLGITTFKQIAAWTSAEEEEFGEKLAFPGRIEREEWVKQAKRLLTGAEPQKPTTRARQSKDGPTSTTGQIKTATQGTKPSVMASPPAGGGDDLAAVNGIGQALERKLNALGVFTYKQIASWSSEEQAWIGNELGFPGRPERENWAAEAAKAAKSNAGGSRKAPAKGEIVAKRKTVIR